MSNSAHLPTDICSLRDGCPFNPGTLKNWILSLPPPHELAQLTTMEQYGLLSMTTEEAMALIEGALDYCRQRQKLLNNDDRDADARAIDHEFEEWLNPQGGILPLMPCPMPEGGGGPH